MKLQGPLVLLIAIGLCSYTQFLEVIESGLVDQYSSCIHGRSYTVDLNATMKAVCKTRNLKKVQLLLDDPRFVPTVLLYQTLICWWRLGEDEDDSSCMKIMKYLLGFPETNVSVIRGKKGLLEDLVLVLDLLERADKLSPELAGRIQSLPPADLDVVLRHFSVDFAEDPVFAPDQARRS
jgi:hypothetical protein